MTLSVFLQAAGEGSWITQLFPILLILVVFYFFMIRPQTKKAKDAKKFREAMSKGDKVITIGGLHGKIVEVKDQHIIMTIANGVDVKVQKSSVSPELSLGTGEGELQQKR